MISGYCQGFLTIWWPRLYQFTKFLRFIVPVILHAYQISLIELLTPQSHSLESDFPSISFTICISALLLKIPTLLPERYTPKIRQIKSFLEVLVQNVLVEVSLRLIEIPFNYILHYLYIYGYFVNFANKFIFIFNITDNYVPVTKFLRGSRTGEGFLKLRRIIAYIRLLIVFYLCDLHLPLFCILSKIIICIEFTINFFSKALSNIARRKY